MKRLLPDIISLSRIPFFILLAYLLSLSRLYSALAIFCVAVLTDTLDGVLARHLKVVSARGAILDPLADKLLYLGSLWALRDFAPTTLVFLFTLPSEMMLVAIRFSPLKDYCGAKIPATRIGKTKAGIQFAAIIIIVLGLIMERAPVIFLGIAIAFFAVILSWASLYSHCDWKNKAV